MRMELYKSLMGALDKDQEVTFHKIDRDMFVVEVRKARHRIQRTIARKEAEEVKIHPDDLLATYITTLSRELDKYKEH
jgi:methionine synthase II (cobalamin-independent)